MFFKCDSGRLISPLSPSLYLLYLSLTLGSTLSVVKAATQREIWPWVAFIPSLRCTGAIVHNRWLLTSSQCFENKTDIPSELYIQIQDSPREGNLAGVRTIFVIDYTRDKRLESVHGLTMLYLARTFPSLTREVASLQTANSTLVGKSGIVLSWNSGAARTGFYGTSEIPGRVNIIALSVDITSCGDHSRHLCASLDRLLSRATGSALYCTRVSLGSPLVLFGDDSGVSLIGVLHQRSDCQENTKVLGRFTPVKYANKLIRRQFRIQG